MSRRSDGRAGAVTRTGISPPRWILVALGIALVAVGVLEIVADALVWIYVVHAAAGAAAVLLALRPRWLKPGIVALAAVFIALYVVEAASPDLVGDDPNPSSNGSLILTGVVLLALMVAFMWPAGARDQRDGTGT